MANEEAVQQLKQIKVWIAVGALGFVLIGAAALLVAASIMWWTSMMEANLPNFDSEEPLEFRDLAQKHFETGRVEDLAALITERAATHPNDANVFWYRAQLHALRGEWDDALSDLRQTAFLAPSWRETHVLPLEKAILERQRVPTPSPEPRLTVD